MRLVRAKTRGLIALLAAIAVWSISPAVAQATFPGVNGNFAFGSARNGFPADNDIYTMSGTGGVVTRVTSLNLDELNPSWSHNGHRIVFERVDTSGSDSDIWRSNAAGTNPRPLTTDPGNDTQPAFSNTAAKIVFASDRSPRTPGVADLFVMDANGANQTAITNTPDINESDPAWSPNGQRIAFSRDGDIYTISPAGANLAPVTTGAATDTEPDWSPSSTQIVFHRYENFADELRRINADGSGIGFLTGNGSIPEESPVWSPDGTKIAFIRGAFHQAEVYTMNAVDGSGVTRITNNTTMESSPSWQVVPTTPPPPETEIFAGPPASTQSTSARFEFRSDQQGATFNCRLDGGASETCTSPRDYSSLSIGSHSLEVTAVGSGGADPSPELWAWTITSPPPPGPSSPAPAGTQGGTPAGTAGNAAPVVVKAAMQSSKVKLSRLIQRGVRLSMTCPQTCSFAVRLLQSKKELGRSSGRASSGVKKSVTVKLSKRAKRAVRRRPPRKLTVSVVVRGTNGTQLLKQQRSVRVQSG